MTGNCHVVSNFDLIAVVFGDGIRPGPRVGAVWKDTVPFRPSSCLSALCNLKEAEACPWLQKTCQFEHMFSGKPKDGNLKLDQD